MCLAVSISHTGHGMDSRRKAPRLIRTYTELRQKPRTRIYLLSQPDPLCRFDAAWPTIATKAWHSHFSSFLIPLTIRSRPFRPDIATKARSAVFPLFQNPPNRPAVASSALCCAKSLVQPFCFIPSPTPFGSAGLKSSLAGRVL